MYCSRFSHSERVKKKLLLIFLLNLKGFLFLFFYLLNICKFNSRIILGKDKKVFAKLLGHPVP